MPDVREDLKNKSNPFNKTIFIGCSSSNEIADEYLELAKRVSLELANEGYQLTFGIASSGMMGNCYSTFKNNGRDVYSHTVEIYKDDLKNIDSKETKIHDTTFERTKGLYQDADVILFLPGGTGTMAEFFSILEENRSIETAKQVILFNYNGYYDGMLDVINYSINTKFNRPDIEQNFEVANDLDEVILKLKGRQENKKFINKKMY